MAKIGKGNGMAKFILHKAVTSSYPTLYPNCTFCAAPKVL